jgi:simple sugar transport system ATP-binding protein
MLDSSLHLVEMYGITKRFGAVTALDNVYLTLNQGEVLGLVGDNGAGKSTLMKILSGALAMDEGELRFNGQPVEFQNPRDAQAVGIEMIYQDLALCENLDVASNLYLGREPQRLGFVQFGQMRRMAARELESLGIRIHAMNQRVSTLSGGQRQSVAIGRAVSFRPRVLIMDEPTAALGVKEVYMVLDLIRNVREIGVGVIFITHRLQDVVDVCDRVLVLYEGRNQADLRVSEITLQDIITQIMGGPA